MLTNRELNFFLNYLSFFSKTRSFPFCLRNGLLRRENSRLNKISYIITSLYHFSTMLYLIYKIPDTVANGASMIIMIHTVQLLMHVGILSSKLSFYLYSIDTIQLVNRMLLLDSIQGKNEATIDWMQSEITFEIYTRAKVYWEYSGDCAGTWKNLSNLWSHHVRNVCPLLFLKHDVEEEDAFHISCSYSVFRFGRNSESHFVCPFSNTRHLRFVCNEWLYVDDTIHVTYILLLLDSASMVC